MSTGELLNVEPLELKFPFELKKQISCSLQLLNKTENHVAFKVKTTNPKKYCVRPNTGLVMPRSTCDVIVTMQAQKEAPPDMICRDKFLLQSVVVSPGLAPKDITPEMFSKEPGRVVEECKLRVIYLPPPQPPSPVLEDPNEGVSPKVSFDSGNLNRSELTRQYVSSDDKSSEARALISKLTDEKNAAIQQRDNIRREIELLKREVNKSQGGGVSMIVVITICLIGLILGYLMKN